MPLIIYRAINLSNGMTYVGQTSVTLNKRISRHLHQKRPFGRALKKYGRSSFDISIIDTADTPSELDQKEMLWIERLDCMWPRGYNLTKGGGGASGYVFTDEAKAKLRTAKKNNPMSREGRASVSRAMSNRIVSPETSAKISAAKKGCKGPPITEKHLARLAEYNRTRERGGWTHTQEAKDRLRRMNILRLCGPDDPRLTQITFDF